MQYSFHHYQLDIQRQEFYRHDNPIPMRRKVFQLLCYLITHHDRVVSKDELLNTLWPQQYISDSTLNSCLRELRKAVEDDGQTQRIIRTIRGRGYRFMAPVQRLDPDLGQPPSPLPTLSPAGGTGQESSPQSVTPSQGLTPWCDTCQCYQPVDSRFCSTCGERLLRSCSTCEAHVPAEAAFCPTCGSSLDADALPVDPVYRQVTIWTCRLVDTPTMTARLGAETMALAMQALAGLTHTYVERYGGTEIQWHDDGVTAVFGAPVSYEDHAQRAVLAAWNLQHHLRHHPLIAEDVLWVTISVHSGRGIVTASDHDPHRLLHVLGEDAQVASRLQQTAAPGSILVSDTTYRRIHRHVHLSFWGTLQAQDALPERSVYSVDDIRPQDAAELPQPDRPVSPFIGRQQELALLYERLERAEQGHGQVIRLTGEPGIGKTRLLNEFYRRLRSRQLTSLQTQCRSYGGSTPYLPVLNLVRQLCGIVDSDQPPDIEDKIQQTLQDMAFTSVEPTSMLCQLLDVDHDVTPLTLLSPQARRAHTLTLLSQLFIRRSMQHPLALSIEDLHWIDPGSEEWLATFVTAISGTAILLIVTYRPEYQCSWEEPSSTTNLGIQPLSDADSIAMVEAINLPTRPSETLIREIVGKSGGNPFFLEELSHTVNVHDLTSSLSSVPETIELVLTSRLDRLPTQEKQLLQIASIMGDSIVTSLLSTLVDLPVVQVDAILTRLQRADFLRAVPSSTQTTYVFKHALTQEVAYQSLLSQTRQRYHRQLAHALVAHYPHLVETQPQLLAYHYTEAGEAEPAIPYWLQAGQRAVERLANHDAIQYFTHGLEAIAGLPKSPSRIGQALQLHMALGSPLVMTKGYTAPEVRDTYSQALDLYLQLGHSPQLFPPLMGLWMFYVTCGDLRQALQLGEQLLRMAEAENEPTQLARGHHAVGIPLVLMGNLQTGGSHLEQGMSRYEIERERPMALQTGLDAGVGCLAFHAMALWLMGYPDQASQKVRELLAHAEALQHPFSLGRAWCMAGIVHQFRREVTEVWNDTQQAIALAQAQSFPLWVALGRVGHGWSSVHQGHGAQGLEQLQMGLHALQAIGAEQGLVYHLGVLADACLSLGEVDAGLTAIQQAFQLADKNDEQSYAAELYRLQGELLLRTDDQPQPELAASYFQRSIEVAREQSAKSLELRALMSLHHLWTQYGKPEVARDRLADCFDWFTEGFETADLQAAQRLLHT